MKFWAIEIIKKSNDEVVFWGTFESAKTLSDFPEYDSDEYELKLADGMTEIWINDEWEKADAAARQILDENSRAQCQYLMVAQPDNFPLQNAINTLWEAMEYIWTQYATNKILIESGQEPNELIIPNDLPTIWDVMALKSA